MKRTKRLVAMLLTMIMVFAMTTTVFAANGDDDYQGPVFKITVKNEERNHTYGAFQVFKGDLADGVLSNITWGVGVNGENIQTALGYESASDVAHALEDEIIDVDDFMDVVVANLTDDHVHTGAQVGDEYTITEVRPGYYLLKDKNDSLKDNYQSYTKFLLKVVDEDIQVNPKTSKTDAEKKVYENTKVAVDPKDGLAGKNYNDVADYNIGDDVSFAFYSTVPELEHFETYTYVFEDKMSEGLTFNPDSVTVTVGPKSLVKDTEFTVSEETGDDCTFHVTILDVKEYAAEGQEIRVDFTATLDADANIGLPGNANEMRLKYSNNPNDSSSFGTTVWDKVVVFTYELDVTKVDGEDTTKTLGGAEFILYRENGNVTEYVQLTDNKVSGWTTDKTSASTLVSSSEEASKGLFKVTGLDHGTYFLQETKAPAGYHLSPTPIKIDIIASTVNDQNFGNKAESEALTALKIKINDADNSEAGDKQTGVVSTMVKNNVGATLPETGGIGTKIFYVLGAALMIVAGVALVTRRRMDK